MTRHWSASRSGTIEATYEIRRQGSDLAIAVAGPDRESCLAAAVRGFAAALVEDTAGASTRRVPVEVEGDDDADRLLGLIEEAIVRLDTDGVLTTNLAGVTWSGDTLTGVLTAVDLADVTVTGVAPKAASWHDLRLEPTPEGWRGHVVIDL